MISGSTTSIFLACRKRRFLCVMQGMTALGKTLQSLSSSLQVHGQKEEQGVQAVPRCLCGDAPQVLADGGHDLRFLKGTQARTDHNHLHRCR